eukprot:359702-Chlamydomonas_euryale.AAC.8
MGRSACMRLGRCCACMRSAWIRRACMCIVAGRGGDAVRRENCRARRWLTQLSNPSKAHPKCGIHSWTANVRARALAGAAFPRPTYAAEDSLAL